VSERLDYSPLEMELLTEIGILMERLNHTSLWDREEIEMQIETLEDKLYPEN
jgi:hypothetical protein